MHTGAHHVTIKTSSCNSHFSTRTQGIRTNYTHHYPRQPLPSQMQSTRLQEKLAACPVERKYLQHLYCKENSNVPQVAPRTTREDSTSTAISLTQFFFSSVRSQELVSPGKGGVKEMPVQNDSIIYSIKYTKPQKEQNLLTFIYQTNSKRVILKEIQEPTWMPKQQRKHIIVLHH